MDSLGAGVYQAIVPGEGHETLYKIALDDDVYPDPYALYLPFGVHGPAMVYASRYAWRHGLGVYRPLSSHVIYELHVGTFTQEGTFGAAERRLADLAHMGVTAVELMPISAFEGEYGWGYDGVAHFSTHAAYGSPDELRHFIDEAHGLGLSVFLDVVYSHFGPAGNYLRAFSDEYFRSDRQTPWGEAMDFRHAPARHYVLDSARYWLTEMRADGLRLDATHAFSESRSSNILRELSDELLLVEPKKLLMAEDERNDPSLVTSTGMNGVWADDFHHQIHVTLTREHDGYYEAYRPGALGIADCIRGGWLYEGQLYAPTGEHRGGRADALDASSFIYAIQNHDQIGNREDGLRLTALAPPAAFAAASALLLFLPMTPLLFMGQEWGATTPFLYFSHREPDGMQRFAASKLDWAERASPEHAALLDLHTRLLRLRRLDLVLSSSGRDQLGVRSDGTVLVAERWSAHGRRLFVVNFSDVPADVPLLPGSLDDYEVLLASNGAAHDRLGGWAFAVLGDARGSGRAMVE